MAVFERCFSNFCSDTDDYRPTQSSLLTRFTSTDCSDMWRTSNQDYGAFYYRSFPSSSCIVDSLKAKIHRRQHRFQNWLSCQARGPPSSSCNTSTIFPSTRTETVRITHRKRFVSNCDADMPSSRPNLVSLSPCGEDGLITEYIVKRVLKNLQTLIHPGEYCEVAECAQLLVTEFLTANPLISTNEIVDRVVNTMITPPHVDQPIASPCCWNVPVQTASVSPCHDHPTCVSVSTPIPIDRNPQLTSSQEAIHAFDKLAALENAMLNISKLHCPTVC